MDNEEQIIDSKPMATQDETIRKYKKFMGLMSETPFTFIEDLYGISMTLKEFFEECTSAWYDAVNLLRDRYDFANDVLSNIDYKKRNEINQLFLMMMTVETERFSEEYHNAESEKTRKEIYKRAIDKYFGEGLVETLRNDELDILANKEVDINDVDALELIFRDKSDIFVYMFSAFKITINKVIIKNMDEFKRSEDSNTINYDLVQMLSFQMHQKLFSVIDKFLSNKTDNKAFSKSLIIVNKDFNDEVVMPKVSEAMTSGDVAGIPSELFSGFGGYGFPFGEKKKKTDMIKRAFPKFPKNVNGKNEIGTTIFKTPKKKGVDITTYEQRNPKRSSTYAQDATEYE